MAPNALDRALAHPGLACHGAHSPSDSTSLGPSGSFHDRRDFLHWQERFATSSRRILKSRYSEVTLVDGRALGAPRLGLRRPLKIATAPVGMVRMLPASG